MPLIRTLTSTDLKQVCLIEQRIHRAPWSYDIFHHCLWLNYRCRVITHSDSSQKKIIGYCISRIVNQGCHILNIGIDINYQNTGYAHQLLDELIFEMKNERDIDCIFLEVRPSNMPAINLYQQYGFQQTGVKKNYYQNESDVEDALIFTLSL